MSAPKHYVMPSDSETACEINLARTEEVPVTSNAHIVDCRACQGRLMRSWFGRDIWIFARDGWQAVPTYQ